MKVIRYIPIILGVALVGIQFVPTHRNQGDLIPITALMLVNTLPVAITEKLNICC
jgi:hypothetical protein